MLEGARGPYTSLFSFLTHSRIGLFNLYFRYLVKLFVPAPPIFLSSSIFLLSILAPSAVVPNAIFLATSRLDFFIALGRMVNSRWGGNLFVLDSVARFGARRSGICWRLRNVRDSRFSSILFSSDCLANVEVLRRGAESGRWSVGAGGSAERSRWDIVGRGIRYCRGRWRKGNRSAASEGVTVAISIKVHIHAASVVPVVGVGASMVGVAARCRSDRSRPRTSNASRGGQNRNSHTQRQSCNKKMTAHG